METIIKEFESWGEYLEYVNREPTGDGATSSRQRQYGDDDYFTKTKNFAEAMDIARNGWKAGADKVKVISDPMFLHISSLVERHNITHDVEGIQVDIARYLEDEPECWIQWDQAQIVENSGVRIIKLVFNGCVSSGVSTETIERCGAVVTSLVELLEYSGTRVEVYLEQPFTDRNEKGGWGGGNPSMACVAQVKLKAADQPLDVPRLAFAFGHPASLRRLGFSFIEQQDRKVRDAMGYSYGYPGKTRMKADIIIPEMNLLDEHTHNSKVAEAWLINELQKQGIELKKEAE